MATAAEEIAMTLEGAGCLGKAKPEEPVFILRGQDDFAEGLVRMWADCVARFRGGNHPRVLEARRCADAMALWPIKKVPD